MFTARHALSPCIKLTRLVYKKVKSLRYIQDVPRVKVTTSGECSLC